MSKTPEKLEGSKNHEWIQAEAVLTNSALTDSAAKEQKNIESKEAAQIQDSSAFTPMNFQTKNKVPLPEIDPEENNIWKWAEETAKAKELQYEGISTIFVMGNKGAGKTSLINCFLEKQGTPKSTLALDFCFARRTTSDLEKQTCHIWELGGDVVNFADLLEAPITHCKRLDKLSLAIVLDLSNPNNIWTTLEASVFHAKKAFSKALTRMDKGDAMVLAQGLETKMAVRLREVVQDKDFLDPFPIPVLIIGTKYDIFQSLEPEKRKTICRLLRIASHRFGASLNFYSHTELSLNRRIRELFSFCAFDTAFPKEICLDMMSKPLLIPFGGDSYQQIWSGTVPSQLTLEYCRHLYETKIGKSNAKFVATANPALDPNYKEYEIDQLRERAMERLKEKDKMKPMSTVSY